MTLAGRDRNGTVMLEENVPMVYLRGAGLGEQVSEYPDTFWSYGAIDSAMDDVHAHVAALKNDIGEHLTEVQGTEAGRRFYQDWIRFNTEWTTWYARTRHSISGTAQAAIGGLQSTLRGLAQRYNGLESRYHALGFDPTPVGGPGPHGGGNVLPTEAWVGIGIGAGVIALGFVAWIASSVSKVAGPIAKAGARGRKR